MMNAAELAVILKARDQASPVFKDVADSSRGLGDTLGNVAKAGALMGAGLAAGAVVAITAASDVAESQNKVNVIFGEGAGVINDWAKGAATNLGLSRGAALDAAGSFGNMFDQLGIGADQSANMSKEIIGLAADFGSFQNADISEVIGAQSAAFRGEYDALQRFLPLINAATVEQQALEMTGKKTTKELTAQEKALAVHALMLTGAGKAAGDFKNTQDGMANSLKIIKASFEDVVVEIGSNLLPIVAPLISAFAKGIPVAIETAKKVFDVIVKSTEGLRMFLMGIWTVISENILPIFNAFKEGNYGEVFATLGDAALQLMDVFTEFLNNIIEWLSNVAQVIIEWVTKWAQEFVGWIVPMIPMFLNMLGRVATSLVSWLSEQVPVLIDYLGRWATEFIAWVLPMIPPFIENLLTFLGSMLDWLVANAPTIAEKFISEWVPAAIGWVARAALMILPELPGILLAIGGWIITEGVPKLIELAWNLGTGIIKGIVQGIANAGGQVWTALMGAASDAIDKVKKFLGISSPSLLFMTIGEEVMEGFGDGIEEAAPVVLEALETSLKDMEELADRRAKGIASSLMRALGLAGTGSTLDLIKHGLDAFAKAEWIADMEARIAIVAAEIQAALAAGLDPTDIITRSLELFEAYRKAVEKVEKSVDRVKKNVGIISTGSVTSGQGSPYQGSAFDNAGLIGFVPVTPSGNGAVETAVGPTVNVHIEGPVYGMDDLDNKIAGSVKRTFLGGGLDFLGETQ